MAHILAHQAQGQVSQNAIVTVSRDAGDTKTGPLGRLLLIALWPLGHSGFEPARL